MRGAETVAHGVDVLIAGAGPAGAAAAAVLAPAFGVLMVDPVAAPGWRIGESLPGAARRLLRGIGAWELFEGAGHAPAPARISRWGDDTMETLDTFRDPDGCGWLVDRARFEADLRSAAMRRGARLVAGRAVRGLSRHPDGGWAVTLDDGASIRARWLLDASGRNSRLLRPFGQRRLPADRLACVWRLSANVDPGADRAIRTEAGPFGWWYTASVGPGRRLVAFHGDSDTLPFKRLARAPDLFAVARRAPGLERALTGLSAGPSDSRGVCAAGSVARSAAGDGWLAAGDAAVAFDPLSSQGLFNALATGVEAGETLKRALAAPEARAGSDGPAEALRAYAWRIGRIWQAYGRHLALFYGMERRWPDAPFWQRRQQVRPAM